MIDDRDIRLRLRRAVLERLAPHVDLAMLMIVLLQQLGLDQILSQRKRDLQS